MKAVDDAANVTASVDTSLMEENMNTMMGRIKQLEEHATIIQKTWRMFSGAKVWRCNDALSEKDTTEGDSSSKEASPSEYSDSSASSSESSDDDDVDDDKPDTSQLFRGCLDGQTRTMSEFLDLREKLCYDEFRQLQEDVKRKMKDVTNNEEVEKLRKEFREKLADLTRWVKGDITTIVVAFQNASSTSSSESSDDEFDVDELDQAAAADHYEGMAMRTRGAVALALVVVLAVAVALARQSKP